METTSCQCVFPSQTEDEIVLIEGSEPGTAIRVYLQAGPDGYVRLQQLAHDDGLGWYVQKTMVIPGDVLHALLPQLRKADCLILRRNEPTSVSVPFMKLTPADPLPQRRGA
jgi:hypothetical protein